MAGSAHVDDGVVRANESRIYLDGVLASTHRKLHPFATKHLGGERFEEPMVEDLTRERKTLTVLAGEHTRLAVVICADLNDALIPALLEQARVNLLLVPALTPSAGAFNGALCGLASRCQGASVVVNAELDALPDGRIPVPRDGRGSAAGTSRQSAEYPANGTGGRGTVAVVDLNEGLDAALTWRS